jgi:integration host factor subunit beta
MADKKYTKTDIVDSLYEKTGIDKKDIRTLVELFTGEIKDALAARRTIELRGFGTFGVKVRKGRLGARNPRTGEPIEVSSHGVAVFRAGQDLKRRVWRLPGEAGTPEISRAEAPEDRDGGP